jgi:hypothetical protein
MVPRTVMQSEPGLDQGPAQTMAPPPRRLPLDQRSDQRLARGQGPASAGLASPPTTNDQEMTRPDRGNRRGSWTPDLPANRTK